MQLIAVLVAVIYFGLTAQQCSNEQNPYVTDPDGAPRIDTVQIIRRDTVVTIIRDTIRTVIHDTVVVTRDVGTGLMGSYFKGRNFEILVYSRVDQTVDFNWGEGGPQGLGSGSYSIRWTGFIVPDESGVHVFHTLSDDGVRLWVDGQLIIDDWQTHPLTENQGTITLTAQKKHAIVLEYYEGRGDAAMRLLWSTPLSPRMVIPTANLYSR